MGKSEFPKQLAVIPTERQMQKIIKAIKSGTGEELGRLLNKYKITYLDLISPIGLGIMQVGSKGAKRIGEALKINTTLLFLNIRASGIGNEGANYIEDALRINTTLLFLKFRSNGIECSKSLSIKKLVKRNVDMVELGITQILDSIKRNSKLLYEVNTIKEYVMKLVYLEDFATLKYLADCIKNLSNVYLHTIERKFLTRHGIESFLNRFLKVRDIPEEYKKLVEMTQNTAGPQIVKGFAGIPLEVVQAVFTLHRQIPPTYKRKTQCAGPLYEKEYLEHTGKSKIDLLEKYPLHAAVLHGDIKAVNKLLVQGVDPNQCMEEMPYLTPLHCAVRKGDFKIAELLIKYKALVTNQVLVEKAEYGYYTPLHLACKIGDINMVELFLKNGANPNTVIESRLVEEGFAFANLGETIFPIDLAIVYGHAHIVDLLMSRFTDIFDPIACNIGDIAMDKLFLENGANPSTVIESRFVEEGSVFANSERIIFPIGLAIAYGHAHIVDLAPTEFTDKFDVKYLDNLVLNILQRYIGQGRREDYIHIINTLLGLVPKERWDNDNSYMLLNKSICFAAYYSDIPALTLFAGFVRNIFLSNGEFCGRHLTLLDYEIRSYSVCDIVKLISIPRVMDDICHSKDMKIFRFLIRHLKNDKKMVAKIAKNLIMCDVISTQLWMEKRAKKRDIKTIEILIKSGLDPEITLGCGDTLRDFTAHGHETVDRKTGNTFGDTVLSFLKDVNNSLMEAGKAAHRLPDGPGGYGGFT